MPSVKVTIVDYGAGNIRSVVGALSAIGVDSCVEDRPGRIRMAGAIVLPGVGSFNAAMSQLDSRGVSDALRDSVDRGSVLLGVCLGMQLLGEWSDEGTGGRGLGLVPGHSRRFSPTHSSHVRIPHMGFNSVSAAAASVLFQDLPPDGDFYFAHSFRMAKDDAWSGHNLGLTDYGGSFVSAYEFDGSVFGVQFHPELSQGNGLMLLSNFARHASC